MNCAETYRNSGKTVYVGVVGEDFDLIDDIVDEMVVGEGNNDNFVL